MSTVDELTAEIKRHSDLYFNDRPEISDYEYDQLVLKLKDAIGVNVKNTILENVGAAPNKRFKICKHPSEMYSLNNAFNEKDINKYLSELNKYDTDLYLEYKYDGLAINLIYVKGKLDKCLTRGNKELGEDVTENILTLDSIPKILNNKDIPDILEVRGEVIMLRDVFNKLNNELISNNLKPFSNLRNAAAGSVRQHDKNITQNRQLEFMPYGIGYSSKIKGIYKYSELMSLLKDFGFNNTYGKAIKKCKKEINDFYTLAYTNKDSLQFDFDGIVIKPDMLDVQREMGFTAHHPRSMIAYKFSPKLVNTKLIGLDFQVSRNGIVSPVGILDPVFIAGVKITKVSLKNYTMYKNSDLRIGDIVSVFRAGEVIPEIKEIIIDQRKDVQAFKDILKCPSCNSVLVNDSVNKVCISNSCVGKNIKRLMHFASRDAMWIDGIGESTATKIIDGFNALGIEFKYTKLYTYIGIKDLLISQLGKVLGSKILYNIEASKNNPIYRLIYSFGINNIGIRQSKEIASKLNSLLDFINVDKMKTIIKGESLNSYLSWINGDDSKNINLVNEFNDIFSKNNTVLK